MQGEQSHAVGARVVEVGLRGERHAGEELAPGLARAGGLVGASAQPIQDGVGLQQGQQRTPGGGPVVRGQGFGAAEGFDQGGGPLGGAHAQGGPGCGAGHQGGG